MARFRVRYRLEGQLLPREDVLDLIGGTDVRDDFYQFSARPIAGTQAIRKTSIIQMLPTSDTTPIQVNHIWRGEP